MTGFGLLLSGMYGALAGILVWLVALVVASPKKNRGVHTAVMVALFALAMIARPAVVNPLERSHAVEGMLNDNRLFKIVLSDNPNLREPMRMALSKAMESGSSADAYRTGFNILSPVLLKYLAKASDASVLEFMNRMVSLLIKMDAEDPNRCYQFLFPNVAGAPAASPKDNSDELMAAALYAVESARAHPSDPDLNAGRRTIQDQQARLIARFGNDVSMLQKPDAPNVDRGKVVTMILGLYSDLLALPPTEAATALRTMWAH